MFRPPQPGRCASSNARRGAGVDVSENGRRRLRDVVCVRRINGGFIALKQGTGPRITSGNGLGTATTLSNLSRVVELKKKMPQSYLRNNREKSVRLIRIFK